MVGPLNPWEFHTITSIVLVLLQWKSQWSPTCTGDVDQAFSRNKQPPSFSVVPRIHSITERPFAWCSGDSPLRSLTVLLIFIPLGFAEYVCTTAYYYYSN